MGVGSGYRGQGGGGRTGQGVSGGIYALKKFHAFENSYRSEHLDLASFAGASSSAEYTAMARTRDETRWEGYAVAVNGRWDGFLRLAYPSPLDSGAMVKTSADWVMFVSSISPVTGTGGTTIYPQIAKGEKAGGWDA